MFFSEANKSLCTLGTCSNTEGCHWVQRIPSSVPRAFFLTIDLLSGTKPVLHVLPLPLHLPNHASPSGQR